MTDRAFTNQEGDGMTMPTYRDDLRLDPVGYYRMICWVLLTLTVSFILLALFAMYRESEAEAKLARCTWTTQPGAMRLNK